MQLSEFWVVARVLCSCQKVLGGCYVAVQFSESSGWMLGCCVVVREFWVVARVLCSCQRVMGGC